jgi:DNA-binding transcriptional MerR regulator
VYQADVLNRLALIKATKAAGFTLAEIQKLSAIWETEGHLPTDWRQFVEKKLNETEAVIRQAQQMQAILNAALACGCWDGYTMPLDSFVAQLPALHFQIATETNAGK